LKRSRKTGARVACRCGSRISDKNYFCAGGGVLVCAS
jgi:hypothetical protein